MSDNKSILEQLRERNPFMSGISPFPFENKNSDLAQLNSGASEEIEQLLRTKRRNPEIPLAGLVLGEQGTGKTHMLTRILRRLRDNARPIIFVAVKTAQTFTSTERVTLDLWKEILNSMAQIHSEGRSQFDMLLSRMMDSYRERRADDGFKDLTKLEPRVYLAKDMIDIDRDFLKCVMSYLGATDELTKMKIWEWLRDGLDEEEALALGLPLRGLNAESSTEGERTARKFMLSLGCILAYSHVSMVVCFDQFEPIRDKELMRAFGDTISMIMNDILGMIPLCFSRQDIWEGVLRPELDISAVQRLEHHKMIMKPCTLSQARQLVRNRIEAAFPEDAEEKYQWLISRMDNILIAGRTPRKVIEDADHIIRTAGATTDEEEIYNTIKGVYDTERSRIQDEPNTWLPNQVHLTAALNAWLSSHDGLETSAGDGKYVMLFGNYGDKRSAFIVITAKNSSVAVAGIRRGISFLREYSGGACVYITESRTHKSTWKRFKDQQEAFEKLGGVVIILDNNTRPNWYALTSLLNQIDGGDITLYLSSGNRPATREDIKDFVKTLDLIPGLFGKEPPAPKPELKPEPKPAPIIVIEPDVLKVNLKNVINSSPMKIITLEKALSGLEGRKVKVTRAELLAFINAHKGDFRTYKSANDVMLAFAKR